jgi:serine protease Do
LIAGGIVLFLAFLVVSVIVCAAVASRTDEKTPPKLAVAAKVPRLPTQSEPVTDRLRTPGGPRPSTPVPRPAPPARKFDAPPARDPKTEPDEPPARRMGNGQLSARALKDLKGATVFIKVEAGRASCSGSGFLVRAEGNAGFIITNHHVINPEAELLRPVRSRNGTTKMKVVKVKPSSVAVTVVFNSGTKAERTSPAEVIATDESRDLAVLRVAGRGDWPRAITLEDKAELVETMPVYILGFPFGEALSFKQGNPAITINRGSVSSLREDDFGEMKAVQIDGAINPGNSGGPVVDADGRLVGVSVATIKGTGIGLAIAPEELTHMFEGRVGALALHGRKLDDRTAELEVELQFIDPQKQIRSAALLYTVAATPFSPLKPNADGTLNALPGAQRLALRIDGQKASGTLRLSLNGANSRYLVCQPTYVNGSGKVMFTPVISTPIQRTQGQNPLLDNP